MQRGLLTKVFPPDALHRCEDCDGSDELLAQ